MVYKVIQWGAGNNAQALVRTIDAHPDLDLVGCRVWSEEKIGVDIGSLAGIRPLGVFGDADPERLYAMDADVVFFLPAMLPDSAQTDEEAVRLLRSGKNVISLSGSHPMPQSTDGDFGEKILEACREGSSTFVATGVNPGFIAERLAPTLTGLCADVQAVTVSESYDCSNSTAALLFDTMGFGVPAENWSPESPFAQMFDRAFRQVIHSMAHTFGFELERVDWTCQTVPAHRDISVAGRVVAKGTVAGITQTWTGIPKDLNQIVLKKVTQWACADDVPNVPVHRGWKISTIGKPSLVLHLESLESDGVENYAENMVGAAIPMVPEVVKAPPGILMPKIQAPFKKRF